MPDILAADGALIAYSAATSKKSDTAGGIQHDQDRQIAACGGYWLGLVALLAATPAMAANSVSAGVLTVERPTLISAGFPLAHHRR